MIEGKRVPDVEDTSVRHTSLEPGEYRREKDSDNVWRWRARPPGDHPITVQGTLGKHEVTEHEDGTITVSPSILIQTNWRGEPQEWHGYLEHGQWREV